MKRAWLPVLLVVALLWWAGGARATTPPTIYIVNHATKLADAAVIDALPAFQASVSNELHRYWGVNATLTFAATDPPAAAETITLTDDVGVPLALAYHGVSPDGVPYAIVGVETSWQAGYNWQNGLSHELDEMLVDPQIDRMITVAGRSYLVEVCDPTERDFQGYWRRSLTGAPVLLSDFVTPHWYSLHKRGPFDLHRLVTRPLQLLPGGYVTSFAAAVRPDRAVQVGLGRPGGTLARSPFRL